MDFPKPAEPNAHLEGNKNLLRYIGVLPWPATQRWRNAFCRHTSVLFTVTGSLLVCAQFVDMPDNRGQLDLLAENIFVVMIICMMLIRLGVLKRRRSDVARFFDTLARTKTAVRRAPSPVGDYVSERHGMYSVILTRSFLTMIIFAGIGYIMVPFLNADDHKPLPFNSYTPYNVKVSPNYELTFLWFSVQIIFDVSVIAICDSLFMVLTIELLCQFKLLNIRLENLREDAVMEVRAKRARNEKMHGGGVVGKSVMEMRAKRAIEDVEMKWWHGSEGFMMYTRTKRVIDDVERGGRGMLVLNLLEPLKRNVTTWPSVEVRGQCEMEVLPNGKRSAVARNSTEAGEVMRMLWPTGFTSIPRDNASVDKGPGESAGVGCVSEEEEVMMEMERSIRECVDIHHGLLRFVKDLEAVFKEILLFQAAASLLMFCGVAFQTTKITQVNARFMSLLQVLSATMIELLLFCWFSTTLTHQSLTVNEAVYSCDWLNASPGFKKAVQIILLRTMQPCGIRVAGCLPVTLELFRSIINTSYSFYTLLVQMDSQDKKHHRP